MPSAAPSASGTEWSTARAHRPGLIDVPCGDPSPACLRKAAASSSALIPRRTRSSGRSSTQCCPRTLRPRPCRSRPRIPPSTLPKPLLSCSFERPAVPEQPPRRCSPAAASPLTPAGTGTGCARTTGEDWRQWATLGQIAPMAVISTAAGMWIAVYRSRERRDAAAIRAPCVKHGRSLLTASRCYYQPPPRAAEARCRGSPTSPCGRCLRLGCGCRRLVARARDAAWLGASWPSRLMGLVLAFGAGALVSAVSGFQLFEEAVKVGGAPSVGDSSCGRRSSTSRSPAARQVVGRHGARARRVSRRHPGTAPVLGIGLTPGPG